MGFCRPSSRASGKFDFIIFFHPLWFTFIATNLTGHDQIYLDVVCGNRPCDDQNQMRVHLEAEAIFAVVSEIERGDLLLLPSDVVDLEIAITPDLGLRDRLQVLIPHRHRYVRCEQKVSAHALALEQRGFAGIDALHVSGAESAGADAFLTTDDRLLRLAVRHAGFLRVRVANPLAWMRDRLTD